MRNMENHRQKPLRYGAYFEAQLRGKPTLIVLLIRLSLLELQQFPLATRWIAEQMNASNAIRPNEDLGRAANFHPNVGEATHGFAPVVVGFAQPDQRSAPYC